MTVVCSQCKGLIHDVDDVEFIAIMNERTEKLDHFPVCKDCARKGKHLQRSFIDHEQTILAGWDS